MNPRRKKNDPGAGATATRVNETHPHERRSLMNTINHPDLPRCVDCGNTAGPWVPTGEFGPHGQTFRCAPGHGCTDRDAIAERVARERAQAEIDQAHAEVRAEIIREAEAGVAFVHKNVIADIEAFGPPLPELADCTGIGLHHLAGVVANREQFTAGELICIAIVLGRLPGDWFPAVELEFLPADEQPEVAG